MRTVVTTGEVFHLWANEAQKEARSNGAHISFNGASAYSYGAEIGRIVRNAEGKRAYVYSRARYSNTTSKHQSYLRGSIPHGETAWAVPELSVGRWNTPVNPDKWIADLTEELPELLLKAGKARKNRFGILTDVERQSG